MIKDQIQRIRNFQLKKLAIKKLLEAGEECIEHGKIEEVKILSKKKKKSIDYVLKNNED